MTRESETNSAKSEAFEPDARKWLHDIGSIRLAQKPISYLGENAFEIANVLDRPLTLDDCRFLVRADGPPAKCAIEDMEFQPVAYVAWIPEEMPEWVRMGIPLTEMNFSFDGSYFHSKGRIITVSGAPFFHFEKEKKYLIERKGVLARAAEAHARDRKSSDRHVWGVTLTTASKQAEKFKEDERRREKQRQEDLRKNQEREKKFRNLFN